MRSGARDRGAKEGRLRTGVFNEWTKKSLERLTVLMPGRYAKPELSSSFLAAIDSYVYKSPLSQVSLPASSNAGAPPTAQDQTTHPAPQSVGKGVVEHATPQ